MPIEDPAVPIESTESTGPNKKVFLQPHACRPDNSQLTDGGLLSTDHSSPEGMIEQTSTYFAHFM